ncbi:MAG: acyl-CoA reductase [Ferruginibacter sp.]
MNLQARINLMLQLGEYLKQNDVEWQEVKQQATYRNGWFSPAFIDKSCNEIITQFLEETTLRAWVAHYHLDDTISPKNIGLVMAGNIPLVGFHDFLTVFISGHHPIIKLSSKDDILLKFLIQKLYSFNISIQNIVSIANTLKGCDAYIATGSNNSARYFEQYFAKYPHIIRKNRTSVAILNGKESDEDLLALSDDIHLYFGLGCRNVSKLFVPDGYDFVQLIQSFKPYDYFADHYKFKNNYDYQLSIILLNHQYYMASNSAVLTQNDGLFSPISHVYYDFYADLQILQNDLKQNDDIQCIIGEGGLAFGTAQHPGLFTYADGVDTMAFLLELG